MFHRFKRFVFLKFMEHMVRTWRRHNGDLRFGQWLWTVCGGDPFPVEDDQMADKIARWRERN